MSNRFLAPLFIAMAVCWLPTRAECMDHVSLLRDGKTSTVSGKVLVEAVDGGLLLVARDGVYWPIQPGEITEHTTDDSPFTPLTKQELASQLLARQPPGFRIHHTAHYVICYDTSTAYAVWCGGLFERLFRGFYGYWKNRGLELQPPEFPLSALVFHNRKSYSDYARHELGGEATAIIGYYSFETNRVATYDLTGADALRTDRRRARSTAHVNLILSRPEAERTVATIVHEATHQLAYNCGLQTRYAPNPIWVSEGIAVYFETPDLRSSKGWRSIGAVNRLHLNNYRASLPRRSEMTLFDLLNDDLRFQDPKTSPAAYSDAWAFNYFLLKTKHPGYVPYLRKLSQLKPLAKQSVQERREQFCEAFGEDLDDLNRDFLRFMKKVD